MKRYLLAVALVATNLISGMEIGTTIQGGPGTFLPDYFQAKFLGTFEGENVWEFTQRQCLQPNVSYETTDATVCSDSEELLKAFQASQEPSAKESWKAAHQFAQSLNRTPVGQLNELLAQTAYCPFHAYLASLQGVTLVSPSAQRANTMKRRHTIELELEQEDALNVRRPLTEVSPKKRGRLLAAQNLRAKRQGAARSLLDEFKKL